MEQCNGSSTFAIKELRGQREKVELSFHYDASDIKGMDGEKMISSSFGELYWASANLRLHVRTPDVWVALPLRWVKPTRHVALGMACPCLRREPSSRPTWGHLVPGLACHALRANESRVRIRFFWIICQDPSLLSF